MKYNYAEMKENEHSYDNFDLRTTNEVPAVYVRSKVPEDNGNPYIEALPEARTEDEVFITYNKQPLFPNEKEGQELWYMPMFQNQIWTWRRLFRSMGGIGGTATTEKTVEKEHFYMFFDFDKKEEAYGNR